MTVATPLFTELPGKIYNGKYTAIGPKGHRTFKISTVDAPDKPGIHGKRIIYCMVGPDNVFDYVGVGFLLPGDEFKAWKRMEGTPLEKNVKALMHILKHHHGECSCEPWSAYRVEESRRCLVCNRELTEPTSIELGIGPVCRQGGRDA